MMWPFPSTVPLLTALLLLSCDAPPGAGRADGAGSGNVEVPADTLRVADLPRREEFVRGGLIPLGSSRASFAGSIGEPDSIAALAVPNRHIASETDTLFTLYYPGLVAHTHMPGPGSGGELLSSVEVSANRYLRYPIIGMGAPTVESAFGPPDERTPDRLTYRCTTCVAGDDPAELHLESGRVRSVRFNFYVD